MSKGTYQKGLEQRIEKLEQRLEVQKEANRNIKDFDTSGSILGIITAVFLLAFIIPIVIIGASFSPGWVMEESQMQEDLQYIAWSEDFPTLAEEKTEQFYKDYPGTEIISETNAVFSIWTVVTVENGESIHGLSYNHEALMFYNTKAEAVAWAEKDRWIGE